MRRVGLDVSAPKPGPDLRVISNGRAIYVEAIAPTPGNPLHADAVRQPVYIDSNGNPIVSQVPHTQIILRIAGAFRAKADIFDRYRRRGYVGAIDPCIVAINLYDIPHAWADADEFWFRAMYGVGNRFVMIDRAGGATIAGREHRALLHRADGAAEDVAPLLNADRAGISGVIGSAADAGNVPQPPGDDFLLMPHAAPRSNYPPGFIGRGKELKLRVDRDERWLVETIDYGAHGPRGPEPIVVELEGNKIVGEWAIAGRILSVRIGGRRCDVPIKGGDDPLASAHAIAVEILRAG